jgi:hypothetical protein
LAMSGVPSSRRSWSQNMPSTRSSRTEQDD